MKRAKLVAACSAALALTTLVAPFAGAQDVDPKIPSYKKQEGISGNLNSVGSDTLNNLMTFWAEQFRKYYPNVNIQIEGKGSSTAPPALIEGTSQLGPMSRAMKAEELEGVEKKYGYPPTQIAVALDALAVYVNKDNPVESLSLPQIDAIFGKSRKLGHSSGITTWGQVGLKGDWANKPISIYGRNSASGTYGYFKKVALGKGDFKNTVKEQPGSASVVLGITEDMGGIGYSGIGYKTSGVKAIAVTKDAGGKAYEPNYENVLGKKYPIARALYVYVLKEPGKPINPMVGEFLKLALSKEGQETVVKDGYLPLPAPVAKKQVGKL